uniref:non-specific serine/threonine protein kinase n=1 Tax=Salarias fasciatus TaxID=181472 RepID=A0A672H788_SALFA
MSLVLHNLLLCCKGLDSDKATERKKEAENFRRLLRATETLQELDRNSGSKAKGTKQLTWDAVFRFLQRYVQKETETIQSSRANVTATTLATRQKKMAEMCSLIKYFIRYANKRGPRLKCSELLKHVIEVLQSSYCCSAYGENYSSLLVKDILSVRKYWCDITSSQWHSLLDIYCNLFNSSSKSINRVLLSRVIHTVVQGCCSQTDGAHDALFSFFSKALLNAKQEKQLVVLEHLLSALNIFLRSVAMNCRMRVCRLGKELLPSVLSVWADMSPSTALKEEIVEFFSLQVCVHHPRGATTQDTGAHAENWTRWKSLLFDLYDALVREISKIGSRGKYVTGTRHIAVKENLVELTADVCHQVRIDIQILEATQSSSRPTQMGSPSFGTPSKRRRIEISWEVLRGHLQPQQSDFDVIPWLQVTAMLTSKYPSTVPSKELVALLSVLLQLLAEQRRGEMGMYVLRCLREVARCQARLPHRVQAYRAELSRLWVRVWALAVRAVSAPQTESCSLDLLSSIVHGELINMDREFWRLFSGSACKPSQGAAVCLTQALLKCPVPKSLRLTSGWDFVGGADGSASPSLKETLIGWLLMSDQSDEMEESSRPHPILCRWCHLLSLTLTLHFENLEIERLYLQFSFDTLPSELRPASESTKTSADCEFAVVPGLRSKLEQSLLCVADNLLNCYSPDSQSTSPECVVRCFSLLTGVLAGYISIGFLTEEEACRSPLFTKAKDNISRIFLMILPASLLADLAEISKLLVRRQKSHSSSVLESCLQHKRSSSVSSSSSAKSLLADDLLALQDLTLLAVLEFLCQCASIQTVHGLLFKPQEVRRRLLLLVEQVDFSKALHLNMYLVLLKKLPAEDSISPEDFDLLLRPLADLCSLYRQDQEVCAAVLLSLLPSIKSLGKTHQLPEEMRHVQGSLLQVLAGFCILSQSGKCVSSVRAALVRCLIAVLEVDPRCVWAVLSVRGPDSEEEQPISDILPSHLADDHHHVRMLVAMSLNLQHPEQTKMLPLKHQQAAFENIYLKAQEGMRSTAEQQDETFNRKATLLKCLSVVLCCSPVCEKQALFALFQSYKENNIEEQLIKKMLCSVSSALGYRSVKAFVSSHLYYLVAEWLSQRQSDDRYTLGSFPYSLLGHNTVKDFYHSSYQVLIPQLVVLDDFEQVKSIGRCLEKDWRELLADCFPKIMVNILPYFALSGQDSLVAQQREKAHRVYDVLKDAGCLGKQQIDSLIHSNLADIVVELLMTLYEGRGAGGDLRQFTGELDPVPNPPYFSSDVIKSTMDYLSKCHSANHKSLVAILSKTPISIQRILLAVCERAAETTNSYERHRVLLMYRLFVSLLLREVKDGLGGAWAFVLRDIIYTLIHNINSRSVSNRSLSLCCDLLTSVCQAALHFCDDALDCHLQVIVGTLTAQVTTSISQQVLSLLQFLVIENQQKLKDAISSLEPFPDIREFRELRSVQHKLKYNTSTFNLRREISHFLSVASCDSLPLTRLEGLKDLTRQLHDNKEQILDVLIKLALSLLQLCKLAVNHHGGAEILEAAGSCLGELGPVDFSTFALLHGGDPLYEKAVSLFPATELQRLFIILSCVNNALTVEVRRAAAQCVRDILATQSGVDFWEQYKDEKDPMLAYLNPFRTPKNKVTDLKAAESPQAMERLQTQEFWTPQAGSHRVWLKALCTALLDSGGVRSEPLLLSRPLCLVSVDCCHMLLPLIIHSILQDDADGSWRELLSSHVRDFFSFCSRSAQASSRSATPPNFDSESDAAMESERFVNIFCDSNFWLELNYLEVAKAAQSCSAHFTALLYIEIYVDKIKSKATRKINFEENSQNLTISSLTERSVHDSSISLQELLIEIYRSIGEPDSLYGCGGETMTCPLTRIRTYEHEAMWGQALTSYDLHGSLPQVTRQVGIMESLQNFGLSSVLSTYMRGLESEGVEWGAELRDLRFQAAWRNTQWDFEVGEESNPGFHESVFCAMQALRDKEFSLFDETLKQARVAEVEELCRGSLEAVSSLYPALRNLQSIRELQSVKHLFSSPFSDLALGEVCRQWRLHSKLLADSDFSLVEPILAVRSVAQHALLSRVADPDSTQYLSSVLTDHLMELCRLARKAGNTQLAERAVYQMKQHSGAGGATLASAPDYSWQLEEAQLFWAKREQNLALSLLRQMIHKLEEKVDINPALAPTYTRCLRLCGNWLAETCLESPGVILNNYLERVRVYRNNLKQESPVQDPRLLSQRTEAFLSLARFSDVQYQSIDKYMKSSEFDSKQALLEKAKEEVSLMRQRNVSNRYAVKVRKELELDEQALLNLLTDRLRFLSKAMENYIRCLELGEEHDTWVFRLASIWLENKDLKDASDIMKKGVRHIPSYKFLPLMYQLAARMGTKIKTANNEDTGFHDVLTDLISRASLEHPHHTLFIIFALVNANKDESFSKSRLSKSSPEQPSPFDSERSDVARKIISAIREKRGAMVRDIERLCDAYITLAYMDASKHQADKTIPIPADQPIMNMKDLDEVSIPTLEIKVDPSGQYENLVTVRSFQPHYRLVGGVNLPKIIDCIGSDGRSRRQLVKGRDDLRQDAVMQQVFGMCSMLLQRDSDTRKRKLNIRQYKVVPFSQCSGVLEWCSGTVPIGEFLVNPNKGAHKRFRPQDPTNLACRRQMMEVQKLGFDKKLQTYMDICKSFRPVFRYFCMERFLDPAVWMEKRLAYTRSVATSSIVGYIVGLGDRHIQNILIDEETAELIHIDLGVAFEQGKVLPTPETVPFRLSRDIVDGMGITGVEGVFRRCCEKTMEVMRSSQEALVTIVEVLLYDPLFDWTMNPLKAFHLQQYQQQELNATSSAIKIQSFNKVAERVLLRLQEKLKGLEEGNVLSVRGQVNLLIQQAMDPKNLSRLFPGWQAWV